MLRYVIFSYYHFMSLSRYYHFIQTFPKKALFFFHWKNWVIPDFPILSAIYLMILIKIITHIIYKSNPIRVPSVDTVWKIIYVVDKEDSEHFIYVYRDLRLFQRCRDEFKIIFWPSESSASLAFTYFIRNWN